MAAALLAAERPAELGTALPRLAEEHDPGFDPAWFAGALSAVDRLPDTLFAAYGLGPQDVSALKAQMRAWAEKISRG